MLTLVGLGTGALLLMASLPYWLPATIVALRMRLFTRINGEEGIAVPGKLVDAARFKQVYSHPAANGRSRGAALSDLFWYWLSPAPEIHQEHLEPGTRYEEVAQATRRILALPHRAAEELAQRCLARVLRERGIRRPTLVRLRDLMMPAWAEFYYELVFDEGCPPAARALIVDNARDVVTALKCCGLRHMEKRHRLTGFLIGKLQAGEVPHALPGTLSPEEQALYLQGVFFNTAVVQMSEAMAHLLMFVAQHDDVQRRLATVPQDDHYLDRVILEGLRFHPLFGISHRITSADIALDQRTTIPRGSVLCFNHPQYHRLGFDHPERFDPDRWETLAAREANYIPFGVAANRPCPAQGLAPVTMRAAAREVMQRFNVYSSASHARSIPNRGPCLLEPKESPCDPRVRRTLLAFMRFRDRWEDVWRSLVQLVLGTYMVLDARRQRLCQRYFEGQGSTNGGAEMGTPTENGLLQACRQRLGSRLDDRNEGALRRWWEGARARAAGLSSALYGRPEADWGTMIREHRAHRHHWYDRLAREVSAREFAAFLLENWAFPPFLQLLERILPAQICEQGRGAILRNIADERVPVPHAELMRRLIAAVKAKAGDGVPLESYPSLIDRTLVFYYGYYCDAWNLVGSLYATEAMAYHRVTHMGIGLARLGIDDADLEFIRIHSVCDEDHAREWSDGVIGPSLRLYPRLRASIAEGIAACLETSARYLDDLSQRAR